MLPLEESADGRCSLFSHYFVWGCVCMSSRQHTADVNAAVDVSPSSHVCSGIACPAWLGSHPKTNAAQVLKSLDDLEYVPGCCVLKACGFVVQHVRDGVHNC